MGWTPGPMEFIVILVVALLFFGRRLPETGRSLGQGIKEFRKGLKGDDDEPKAEEDKFVEAKATPSEPQPAPVHEDNTSPSV